ncbi:MAG: hypothetical protein QXP58_09130, partial [Thermoprotei archaeon]
MDLLTAYSTIERHRILSYMVFNRHSFWVPQAQDHWGGRPTPTPPPQGEATTPSLGSTLGTHNQVSSLTTIGSRAPNAQTANPTHFKSV